MLWALDKMKINVRSLGKDKPGSRTNSALNRRVEVTFDFFQQAESKPLRVDHIAERGIKLLKSQWTLDKDAAQRLLCVLAKMRNTSIDDRYFINQAVAKVDGTNKFPEPIDWSRMRYSLSNPMFFGPKVDDAQMLKHLGLLDTQVIEGIVKLRQLITYYSGAPAIGALTTGNAFRALDAWFQKQLKDEKSIYHCYKSF
jgi:hypothetical protein